MNTEIHEKQSRRNVYTHMLILVAVSILTTVLSVWCIAKFFPSYFVSLDTNSFSTNSHIANSPLSTVGSIEDAIPDMVERVTPAVVSVVVSADVPIIEQYFEEMTPFEGFFGRNFGFSIPRQRQIGTEKREIGGGTGFFVSKDGYIVTNRHVVDMDNVEYSIMTNDGETYPVEVIAKDPSLDIAILKTKDGTDFPFLTFGDSDTLRLGSTAIAIGNALAEFPNSVSVGVISGLSRNIIAGDMFGTTESLEGVIQTDAAINQGNSGGPLLNSKGEVIGVNVAVAERGENIGFALPSMSARNVFESVKEHGEIVRPFMGVRYLQITESIAKQNNLSVDYGVLVVRGESRTELAVIPGSPADKAGIEENDIILEIDGQKLDGSRSVNAIIRSYSVGEIIPLRILHNGEEKNISLTLEKAPTE